MKKLLLAILIAATSTNAFAQTWTPEEDAAGFKKTEQTRFVRSGNQLTLMVYIRMHPDCTMISQDVSITKDPEHGVATIENVERFSNFTKDSSLAKCNEKKVSAPALNYKAAVGYSGTDSFNILILVSGFAHEYHYTINVLDAAKGKGGRADLRP